MSEERIVVRGSELARWLAVAALLAAGIGLFFAFARRTPPVVPPASTEAVP